MEPSESSNGKEREHDLEKGNHEEEGRRKSSIIDDLDGLDEYSALQRYIVMYRDPRAVGFDDGDSKQNDTVGAQNRHPWWAFWRKGGSHKSKAGDPGVVPEDWLNADIRKGISNNDVEIRRRRFGFNEITTEKENLFLKFLSYF